MPYDYRAAIESTERVIQRRGSLHRAQVVAVGTAACTVLVVAALFQTNLVSLLALVVPLSGVFLMADARYVQQWQVELLAAWSRGEIDFTAFRHAITAHPHLPRGTLGAMLDSLPVAEDLTTEQAVDTSRRETIAAAAAARSRRAGRQLLVRVFAAGLLAALVVAAVLIRD